MAGIAVGGVILAGGTAGGAIAIAGAGVGDGVTGALAGLAGGAVVAAPMGAMTSALSGAIDVVPADVNTLLSLATSGSLPVASALLPTARAMLTAVLAIRAAGEGQPARVPGGHACNDDTGQTAIEPST